MSEVLVAVLLPAAVILFEIGLLGLLLREHARTIADLHELSERLARHDPGRRDLTYGRGVPQVRLTPAESAPVPRAISPELPPRPPRHPDGEPAPIEPTEGLGLPIGTPVPEFTLPDLDGRAHRLRDFLGRPLLLVFFDPSCGFSRQLAPQLSRLSERGLRLVLVSRGDPAEHRRLAAEHGWDFDVLLDPEREVARAWRSDGTPTGYLLNGEGRIASDLLLGAPGLLGPLPTVPGRAPAGAGWSPASPHRPDGARGVILPERLTISAVAPNHPPFSDSIRLLFESLRRFGGQLAGARARGYIVGPPDRELRDQLERLEVEVKVVAPVDERYPHANKLRMLETPPGDYLVALDVDTVVVRDFSAYLVGSAIAAKPEEHDLLTIEQWRRMFEYFDLGLPPDRYLCTLSARETALNLNSGVLIIPRQHVGPLRVAWQSFVRRLLEAYPHLPEIAPRRHFTDQYALSLALISAGLPYRTLPIEMNVTTATAIHRTFEPERLEPYILHHHHLVSEAGALLLSPHESVNVAIAAINRRLGPKPGYAARLTARRDSYCSEHG